ncbi:MAG: hypothetical protein ACI835_000655 [Planctomycetota bacterium]
MIRTRRQASSEPLVSNGPLTFIAAQTKPEHAKRRPLKEWRHVDGYEQRDFALRNAGWHFADHLAERLESEGRREGFLDEFYGRGKRKAPKWWWGR